MSFKRFLITESEKIEIRKMYGLLNEQITPTNYKYLKLLKKGAKGNITLNYPSGYYSVKGTNYDNEVLLKPIIDEVKSYLTSKPKEFISRVTVKAGESIIPNYDNEGGTPGKKPIGWLSNKRKEKIEAYVKSQMADLVSNGTISKEPEVLIFIVDAKTKTLPSGPVGAKTDDEKWNDYRRWNKLPNDKKINDPKNGEYSKLQTGYNKDQFTEVIFRIIPDLGPGQCAYGLKIGVHYDEKSGQGHVCNDAKYIISVNDIQLKTGFGSTKVGDDYANMNNAGGSEDNKKNDIKGYRYNYFILDEETVPQIFQKEKEKLVIKAKCVVSGDGWKGTGGCHTDVPHVTIQNIDGTILVDTLPKVNEGILLETTKCGDKILSGGGGTAKTSTDSSTKTTTTQTTTGKTVKLVMPTVTTLTPKNVMDNYTNTGEVSKNSDGTYTVLKTFKYNDITYNQGDKITI